MKGHRVLILLIPYIRYQNTYVFWPWLSYKTINFFHFKKKKMKNNLNAKKIKKVMN